MVARTDTSLLRQQSRVNQPAEARMEKDWSRAMPLILVMVLLVLSPLLFDLLQWVQSLLGH